MAGHEGISYVLTEPDWHLANEMSAMRSRGIIRSKESAELEGAAAEVAFGRVFCLGNPDTTPKRGDGGVDFILPSGAMVDVKAISGNEYKLLGLLVPKSMRAGLYVLVYISFDDQRAVILGYQTSGFAYARGRNMGHSFRVAQSDLRNPRELYEHLGDVSCPNF